MIVLFEISKPFRVKQKIERFGKMTRVILFWFSISYSRSMGLNDIGNLYRIDERKVCAREIQEFNQIKNLSILEDARWHLLNKIVED